MLEIHIRVFSTGTYDYRCARFPILSSFDIDAISCALGGIVVLTIKAPSCLLKKKRSSWLSYPRHIEHYIEKEISKQALMGPFSYPTRLLLHVSPILTCPTKGSE